MDHRSNVRAIGLSGTNPAYSPPGDSPMVSLADRTAGLSSMNDVINHNERNGIISHATTIYFWHFLSVTLVFWTAARIISSSFIVIFVWDFFSTWLSLLYWVDWVRLTCVFGWRNRVFMFYLPQILSHRGIIHHGWQEKRKNSSEGVSRYFLCLECLVFFVYLVERSVTI
jgi:hypothetical protein